jgi:hypothetical protein
MIPEFDRRLDQMKRDAEEQRRRQFDEKLRAQRMAEQLKAQRERDARPEDFHRGFGDGKAGLKPVSVSPDYTAGHLKGRLSAPLRNPRGKTL